MFYVIWNSVWQIFVSIGSWSWRIDTYIDHVEFAMAHEFQGIIEIFFRFSRKANDNISGNTYFSGQSLNIINKFPGLFRRISSMHGFQNFIGTGLERNMNMWT